METAGMRRLWIAAIIVVTLASAALPATAWAGPRSRSMDEVVAEYYRAGRKAYAAGDLHSAFRAFYAAHGRQKHQWVAAHLGAVELELGMYRDAAEHLAEARAMGPEPRTRRSQQRRIDRLCEGLELAKEHVTTVEVRCVTEQTTLFVDGEKALQCPATLLFLEPGHRTLAAVREGYETLHMQSYFAEGTERTLTLSLLLEEPEAPPKAEVVADPEAEESTHQTPLWPAFVAGGVGLGAIVGAIALGAVGGQYDGFDAADQGSLGLALVGGGLVLGATAYGILVFTEDGGDDAAEQAVVPRLRLGAHGGEIGLGVTF